MMKKILKLLTISLLFSASMNNAWALREAKPMAVDSRLKVMIFNPNDVYKYTGFYGYQGNIQFAKSEVISNVSMGDSTAWQIIPLENILFLKPIASDATTNMTVITNKRIYYFEVHAQETESPNDPEMAFSVKFIYPNEDGVTSVVQQVESSSGPDLTQPERFNFNYTISGSEEIAPLKIFDDGEFTYFEFRSKNAEVPAFFSVNKDGEESVINYRMLGKYVVIEKVNARFTLRSGGLHTCVYNEKILSSEKPATDAKKKLN